MTIVNDLKESSLISIVLLSNNNLKGTKIDWLGKAPEFSRTNPPKNPTYLCFRPVFPRANAGLFLDKCILYFPQSYCSSGIALHHHRNLQFPETHAPPSRLVRRDASCWKLTAQSASDAGSNPCAFTFPKAHLLTHTEAVPNPKQMQSFPQREHTTLPLLEITSDMMRYF